LVDTAYPRLGFLIRQRGLPLRGYGAYSVRTNWDFISLRKTFGLGVLSPAEKEKLTLIASRPKSNQRDAQRARIILGASEGLTNTEIARRERVSLPTVGKWRSRYAREKIEALADAPRSGAPRSIGDKKVEEILTKTLEGAPRARTHWSSRLMAKEAGISDHSVLRIWRAFGLKPHRWTPSS
jgi:transposase